MNLEALPRPVGFVLGGGGSLGAMQVGMIRAVHEAGIRADMVVGTSIGAMNGAVLAADPNDGVLKLLEIWQGLRHREILRAGRFGRLRALAGRRSYIYDNAGLEKLARAAIGDRRIENLTLPFGAVAVDVETANAVVLRTGPVVPAVLASAAIPGVFPPVSIAGRSYYDGGLVANVPVLQALEMGAKSLVVLDCVFADRAAPVPQTVASSLLYSAVVSIRQQALRDLEVAAGEVPVIYLPGAPPELLSPLAFGRSEALIGEAYQQSSTFLRTVQLGGRGLYRSSQLR